jgi:hypothetical protein
LEGSPTADTGTAKFIRKMRRESLPLVEFSLHNFTGQIRGVGESEPGTEGEGKGRDQRDYFHVPNS